MPGYFLNIPERIVKATFETPSFYSLRDEATQLPAITATALRFEQPLLIPPSQF